MHTELEKSTFDFIEDHLVSYITTWNVVSRLCKKSKEIEWVQWKNVEILANVNGHNYPNNIVLANERYST